MESFYKGKSHKDGKEESLQWGHPSMWPEMEGRVKNHSQLPSLSSRMDTDGLSTTGRGEGEQQSHGLGSLDTGSELGSSLGR